MTSFLSTKTVLYAKYALKVRPVSYSLWIKQLHVFQWHRSLVQFVLSDEMCLWMSINCLKPTEISHISVWVCCELYIVFRSLSQSWQNKLVRAAVFNCKSEKWGHDPPECHSEEWRESKLDLLSANGCCQTAILSAQVVAQGNHAF